jgi:hypothetical protein
MPTRLLSLIVSFALLLPAGTLGSVLYVCRMTGDTGTSCCCAKRAVEQAKRIERRTSIQRAGCCDAKITAAAERPASPPAADFHVAPPALVTRLPVELSVAVPPLESPAMAERARGPPLIGVPVYLENCALLS